MMRSEMEIDALEDIRVLVQAQCLGAAGLGKARMHAQSLMQRALVAAEHQQFALAEDFHRRLLAFNQRISIAEQAYSLPR